MNITDTLLQHALKHWPEQIAVIDGEQALTYRELYQHTEQLKAQLLGLGVGKGTILGVMGRNSSGFIIAMLASFGCGAVAVPLSHQLKPAEIEHIVENTRIQAILDDTSGVNPWTGQAMMFKLLQQPLRLTWTQKPAHAQLAQLADAAFIRYTSGTTGASKGVVLTHASILARVEQARRALRLTCADAVLWVLPMAFHFLVSILVYLRSGARIIISKDLYAKTIIEAAQRHQASVLYASPMHFRLLAADTSGQLLPSLTTAISTSSAIPLEIAQAFTTRFGVAVRQAYGIIEAGLPMLDNAYDASEPISVGHPVDGFEVEILSDANTPVTNGEIGHLALRGPGMFDAYLSPWQTANQVMSNSWFMTGDLAYRRPDGRIVISGREKSVINVSGNKAFPEEIEAVLNAHAQVAASRVFGKPHPLMGEVVCAEVVLRQAPADIEDIIRFCRKRLSAYKVPQQLAVVTEITYTVSGKVKRNDAKTKPGSAQALG